MSNKISNDLKITVSALPLVRLLQALQGPGHHIAEIQATRSIDKLLHKPGDADENEINRLLREVTEQLNE